MVQKFKSYRIVLQQSWVIIQVASYMYMTGHVSHLKFLFYNGNWTEWSVIWAEIIHVISKSNECTVQVWFEIKSMISD